MTRSVALALERLCANLRHEGVYSGVCRILDERCITFADTFGMVRDDAVDAARAEVIAFLRDRGTTRATIANWFGLDDEERAELLPTRARSNSILSHPGPCGCPCARPGYQQTCHHLQGKRGNRSGCHCDCHRRTT